MKDLKIGQLITFNQIGVYLQSYPQCGTLKEVSGDTLIVNVRGSEVEVNVSQVIGKGMEVVR